ncbi:alpha-crystallin domain-containing protein 22.3-like [Euphorbia lathyris]|uniref:alpha-crystallin domain-containing protein 22.3-like n=1 Tax=Euphorbia lathyris TaxID=212925 RepID=UPI003313AAB6
MASIPRPEGNKGSEFRNLPKKALAVLPLNSRPYIDAPTPVSENTSMQTDGDTEPAVAQTIVLLSTEPTEKELHKLLGSVKSAVVMSGSAATGMMGPHLGKMNIAESDDAYLFLVSLPGVLREEKEFSCDIDPEGKVVIRGVITTGEQIVCKCSKVFKMQSQNLGPPGRFSISFNLPGPVDHLQFTGRFLDGGLLEGVVKKK